MTGINRTDVVFSNSFISFSARDIPVLDTKKQAEIHFLWCFKCSFEFSAFLVPVLNVKKCLEVTENCIQGNLCHLIPILKMQKIQKSNLNRHSN